MLSRRSLILGGAALSLGGLVSDPAAATARAQVDRSLFLYNIHTGETLRTTYWAEGRYQLGALSRLNHLLRDHYSGESHPMEPRVIDLLQALQSRIGASKPMLIISAYRSPDTNARMAANSKGVAHNSFHMYGKAIDVRVEKLGTRALGRAAKSLRMGGVGQYPRSNFVHVDIGPVRYW